MAKLSMCIPVGKTIIVYSYVTTDGHMPLCISFFIYIGMNIYLTFDIARLQLVFMNKSSCGFPDMHE